jgi:hypothetical protein
MISELCNVHAKLSSKLHTPSSVQNCARQAQFKTAHAKLSSKLRTPSSVQNCAHQAQFKTPHAKLSPSSVQNCARQARFKTVHDKLSTKLRMAIGQLEVNSRELDGLLERFGLVRFGVSARALCRCAGRGRTCGCLSQCRSP